MAVKLGDAFVALGVNDRDLDRGLDAARRKVNGFLSNLTTGIGQGIGQAVAQGVGNLIRTAVNETGKAVRLASDLNESLNKTSVAFGDSAQEILDWSRTSATAFGQSRGQALEAASSFGLLFRTMGVTNEASAEMSRRLVELASDMASINNISPEEALIKLRAGLVGEIEPLRTVGVLLNANVVEQKALALGLAETTDQLTEQDKVLARYQLILDQTTLTQGDFARTSDQLANAQRILAAQVEDTSSRFGQALLPIQLAFTRGLSELIRIVEPYGLNIMDSLAAGLARGITAILPVLAQVRALFVYWLKPGSPPRLLKELTEWGRGAMRAYLDGWTNPDLDALRSLGSSIESVLRSFAGAGQLKQTDLVARIFGSERALVNAINEWRSAGTISVGTMDAIRRAAGPAGDSVAELVNAYFNMQQAATRASDAQRRLEEVTRRYDDALSPLQEKLDDIQDRQRAITDAQRLGELGKVINDPRADASERQLARLEQEEILLRQQMDAIEEERDIAIDAEQQKIDAAEAERQAKEEVYNQQQSILDQQAESNRLLAEEIDLRERLANEALAAQEKAMREAEQAARAQAAEMERIADAQLRFRLATADSEGQLAIWREELAKVAVGSADYYDILTQIANLEERIAKERSKSEGLGDLFAPIAEAVGDGGVVEQASEGITALSKALEEAFKVLSGESGTVELAPAWQTFADTLGDLGRIAQEVGPYVQGIIDIIMGRDVAGVTEGSGDPFGDNFWLSGFVPFLRGLQRTLEQYRDSDWSGMWQRFKDYVDDVIEKSDGSDLTTFGLYTWLRDTAIPLLENLASVEWADVWNDFSTAVTGVWDTITGYVQERIEELKGALQELREAWDWLQGVNPPTGPFDGSPGGGGGGGGGGDFSSLPGGGFPGLTPSAPLIPAMAGASSSTVNNSLGPINLVFNAPVTQEAAANAARTVDQELRQRGWSPI